MGSVTPPTSLLEVPLLEASANWSGEGCARGSSGFGSVRVEIGFGETFKVGVRARDF